MLQTKFSALWSLTFFKKSLSMNTYVHLYYILPPLPTHPMGGAKNYTMERSLNNNKRGLPGTVSELRACDHQSGVNNDSRELMH